MAKSVADGQSRLANNASGAACVLAETQVRYLKTVRKLLVEYHRTGGVQQKQLFVELIHAFMQKLCSYPRTSYTVTKGVYSNTEVDNYPHVVPTPYSANSTLFYFTAAQDPDDVHDLWVKHAQVYLAAPHQGDVVAAPVRMPKRAPGSSGPLPISRRHRVPESICASWRARRNCLRLYPTSSKRGCRCSNTMA
jgi:hypothetical protein